MNARTHIPSPVRLTAAAVERVRELIGQSGKADLKLRVSITGGGCSGFRYEFTFDEVPDSDDTVVEKDGIALLIDAVSYLYLDGAEIDFIDSLEGSRFTIENPTAASTCGCGQSFSI